jgi:hypothetical protein
MSVFGLILVACEHFKEKVIGRVVVWGNNSSNAYAARELVLVKFRSGARQNPARF